MSRRRTAPTKSELLQLQKLYKTDEKIGERLGGVPAYLVAYWRRKKNIPKHSLPKFSEAEVRNLWERYGDDEKAGLELGLSKAAFYNWRRRYGIREKPAFLKLEQLELNFPGVKANQHAVSLYGKQTMAQKTIARAANQEKVEVGEQVVVEPDVVIAHHDTLHILDSFREVGHEYVWNPNKVVMSLDYQSDHNEGGLQALREFIKRQRIKHLYDIRDGLCHQVVLEKGHALPGQLMLGTDALASVYGSVGAFGTCVSYEEMAAVWATGKARLGVPETARLAITGRRGRAVYARDIMLAIQRQLAGRNLANTVIEFGGSIVSQMSMSERFALSTLAAEIHARGAISPYDATTRRYLTGRHSAGYKPVIPDKNAEYSEMFQVNIDHLPPQVYCPDKEEPTRAVAEIDGLPVHVIIIGTLTSGRFDDLRVAAEILRGRQVHTDCRLIVIPASRSVYLEALNKGLIRVFIEAGAIVASSGSSGIVSMSGLLTEGERCLATMSACTPYHSSLKQTEMYYCSPATAAASALHAVVTDPSRYIR